MNTELVLKSLKSELKKSRISYAHLAKELKISEAGVKKLFMRGNLSMARAFEICKVLNLSLGDVITSASGDDQTQLRFTDKQAEFFRKNTPYFHFYMKLAYEQKTALQIKEDHRLSLKSLNAYLKRLEELGLIRRHPKDRAQIIGGKPLAISTKGTALEDVKFEIVEGLLKHVRDTGQGTLAGASLFLAAQEWDELKNRWADMLKDYSFLSNSNRRSRKREASPVSVMFVQAPTSMFNDIKEI